MYSERILLYKTDTAIMQIDYLILTACAFTKNFHSVTKKFGTKPQVAKHHRIFWILTTKNSKSCANAAGVNQNFPGPFGRGCPFHRLREDIGRRPSSPSHTSPGYFHFWLGIGWKTAAFWIRKWHFDLCPYVLSKRRRWCIVSSLLADRTCMNAVYCWPPVAYICYRKLVDIFGGSYVATSAHT